MMQAMNSVYFLLLQISVYNWKIIRFGYSLVASGFVHRIDYSI